MASSNLDTLVPNQGNLPRDIAGDTTDPNPQITKTLDEARTSVASALDRAADSVRKMAGGPGQTADWAQQAANKIGCAAGYLRRTDVRRMGEQARDAVHNRPGTALLVAASAGFLLGAILRRR
jgi:ElaB/YqjD/DUF883 family membrane-anchored ribosome-binding protein